MSCSASAEKRQIQAVSAKQKRREAQPALHIVSLRPRDHGPPRRYAREKFHAPPEPQRQRGFPFRFPYRNLPCNPDGGKEKSKEDNRQAVPDSEKTGAERHQLNISCSQHPAQEKNVKRRAGSAHAGKAEQQADAARTFFQARVP